MGPQVTNIWKDSQKVFSIWSALTFIQTTKILINNGLNGVFAVIMENINNSLFRKK